ncbi:hypothetical protein ANN_00701 [Periplaneta americana]|uniref:HAT C-terminal dimerisation domain-containing protein n=1 Tax=Periplaneta americana TaxID=6978 RepID=A0ABQ8TSL2_PERAM|nr:hypothetical protein ANN_00701 [Periplaneta americana]
MIQEKALEIAKELNEYKLAFHEIHKLSIVSIVTPASSIGCERAFLCLHCIKTHLWNRTGHECLSDLAVLAVEQDLVKALDIEDLIDKFDAANGVQRALQLQELKALHERPNIEESRTIQSLCFGAS